MGKVPFNVNAYTARLIGRENLSKLESAIVELVKNSYDADASICIIYYDDKSNVLYLLDNGSGMTDDIIKEHWMTIGYSSKVTTYITKKGRIQTGSKGIGRFALDRISSKCEMLTINERSSIIWNVNWEDFKNEKQITEVYADIENTEISFMEFLNVIDNKDMKKLVEENFTKTGTIFKLTDLRESWTDSLNSRVENNLKNIASPDLENIFEMYFFRNNISINEAKIRANIINAYDYKIKLDIDDMGNAKIMLHRNEFDFGDKLDDIIEKAEFTKEDKSYFLGKLINKDRKMTDLLPNISLEDILKIGPFSGSIYFNKISLNKSDKEKYYYKDITGRRNYTKEFGGIKIFRDKFKVRPYGEYGSQNFDWLMLSQRKTQSPAAVASNGIWRVRGEQVIGEVNISRTNLLLADQANREGLVETKQLMLFKEALISIIAILESDRQYVIRKLNKLDKEKNPVEQYKIDIEELISKMNQKLIDKSNESNKSDLKKKPDSSIVVEAYKVKAVLEERNDVIKSLEDENAMLRTLATTGIITNTYIHELKSLSNDLFSSIVEAKESIQDLELLYQENNVIDEIKDIGESINEAYSYRNKFNSWFKVTIETVREDRRHMKKWSINYLMENLAKSWEEVLDEKNIKIDIDDDVAIEFKCFAYEIESVIHNLVANSVSSFEKDPEFVNHKIIKIKLEDNNEGFSIYYSDNGPGLTEAFKKNPYKILEPFVTDKRSKEGEKVGTGMGMWIIKRIIENYNGNIDLDDNKKYEHGFRLMMIFKGRKNIEGD